MYRLEAYTAADVEAAEKLLSDAVIHALQVVCNQVADTIGQIVTAAAGEPTPEQIAKAMVDAAPGGPPGQPYVSVDDLGVIPSLWKGQVNNLIMPLEGQIYRDSAGKLHAEMVDLVGPQVPSIGSEMAESYLAGAAARWDFMGGEVWETARTQLLDGFQQGESIPKLAARVRSAAGLSQRRALAVARTEVVAASNAGSYATAQVSGLEMSKVWLATEDERTRPTHRTADGQVRPLAEPFTVGISSLQFPGDPSGVPEETRNCRCTLTYEIPDAAVPAEPEPNPLVDLFQATQAELSAAQARQADIDRTIPNSQALIDIDTAIESIIANTGGMKFNANGHLQPGVLDDLIEVINAGVEQGGIAEDIAGAWGEVGDFTHIAEIVDLRQKIFALEKAHSLSRVGGWGQSVTEWTKYDPAKHHLIGEAEPGDIVQVTRIGHVYTREGEQILLSKAEVIPVPKALPKPTLAAPPPVVKPTAPIDAHVQAGDFSGLTKIGPQKGSNPGALFETSNGVRYYVKTAKTEEHARNDALANALYREAGLDMPELARGTGAAGIDSGTQIASRLIEDTRPFTSSAPPDALAEAQRGFALDAWLANWDVVGAEFDNMLIQEGRIFRIDTGGSMLFRAQGGAKGDLFGPVVREWESMRTTGTAGQVFGSMTQEQLRASVELVKKLTPAKIRKIVKAHGFGDDLADLLIARRADLLTKAKALGRRRAGAGRYQARVARARKADSALHLPPVKLAQAPAGPVREALESYKGNGFRKLNEQLRQHKGDTFALSPDPFGLLANIDKAMKTSRLADDVVVLRGFPGGRRIFGRGWSDTDMTGLEWTDHGYSSSTVDMDTAEEFAEVEYQRDDAVILHVLVPKGTGAVQISGREYESELLLQRGLKFRVVADNGFKDGARRLDVEVIR